MVWRQLPKLVPAGSIPVSRSKKRLGTGSSEPFLLYNCTYSPSNLRIKSQPFSTNTSVSFALASS